MFSIAILLCKCLVWLVPGMLLIGRFLRPRSFPWWVIVLTSGLSSYFLLSELEQLSFFESYEEQKRCQEAQRARPEIECEFGTSLVYWVPYTFVRVLPGLVILLSALPLYWLAFRIRKRRRPPNNSLEGSRER